MKIQTMQPSDFKELYALWKKAGLQVKEYKTEKEEFLTMIMRNPTSCLVGIESGKIIGSVFAVFNGRRGWIYHMAIDPKCQKKGYGTKLLQQAEKELAKLGAHKALLGVAFSNMQAVSFYTKNNYIPMNDAFLFEKSLLSL